MTTRQVEGGTCMSEQLTGREIVKPAAYMLCFSMQGSFGLPNISFSIGRRDARRLLSSCVMTTGPRAIKRRQWILTLCTVYTTSALSAG
jgi:hypothetical protein